MGRGCHQADNERWIDCGDMILVSFVDPLGAKCICIWLQEQRDVAGPLKEQCRDMADFDRDSSTKFSFSNFSFKVCKLALKLESNPEALY